MAYSWLVIGMPRNWQAAFEHANLWGLQQTQRSFWGHIEKGENIFSAALKASER